MNHTGDSLLGRIVIVCAAFAMTIFASNPAFAQRKPIVLEPNATPAGAIKALTVIKASGSYVLSRDIIDTRSGVDAVDVTASDVTIDLQGFVIGSTTSSTGVGINATGQSNVVIKNGIISGFGGAAIIGGNGAKISGITASENGSGITCGVGCLVRDNVLQDNSGLGLTFSDVTTGYLANVMEGNSNSTVGTSGQVSGGTSLGENLCNGSSC